MIYAEPYSLKGFKAFRLNSGNNPKKLIQEASPVLPMLFDRSLLPQDICEKQYLKLVACGNAMGFSNEANLCSYEVKLFNDCKTKRDAIIFDRIREWEVGHFGKLDNTNKQMYLQGLTNKLTRLQEGLEDIPSIPSTQVKIRMMTGEIDQTKWRMRYLKKLQ